MIFNNFCESIENRDSIYEMIHEVKNSIAVCRGYLDIIDCNSDGDINKYLSILRKEIVRSTDIISEFMLYRKVNINKEIMDINILLLELCIDIKEFISDKGILFSYDVSENEIYINGDYNKLKQVFINLIKNSVESIIDGNGKISLFSYIKEDYFYIVISDNGVGIADDMMLKIINGGFTTKESGSGIGVSFSNKILHEHGGEIKYKSKVGVGTDVIVKIPIVVL